MVCNRPYKAQLNRAPSPVVISNSAVIELSAPVQHWRLPEGFTVINLDNPSALCQEEFEKELLVK